MKTFAETASARVRAAMRKALRTVGREGVREIRSAINTPVRYANGEAIRSEPGEPPFRETRELWKSIEYKLRPGGSTVAAVSIQSRLERSIYLEEGTENIEPRPFFAPTRARVKRWGPAMIRTQVAQNLREKADADADFDVDV